MIRIVGDIHGGFARYKAIIEDCDRSIQVGDFGFGFNGSWDAGVQMWQEKNPAHRFIRGNHDDPAVCRKSLNWIKDDHYEDGIYYLGGAWSIDWNMRTPGIDWWFDEELSVAELETAVDNYEKIKPDVVITHDAPSSASYDMIVSAGLTFSGVHLKTRTGEALQAMFEIHQPRYWFFGHWHHNASKIINGTHFVCIAEHSYIDFDETKL